MAKKFQILREQLERELADDPVANAEYQAEHRAMRDALALREIRGSRGITQVELAEQLQVTQGNVSQTERQSDVYLSTLRKYVEALGGHLEINAVFPDDSVPVAVGK